MGVDPSMTYRDYYWRAIVAQRESGHWEGLKLVVGPTGLGKTFAIPLAIAQLRMDTPEQRCAYVTHRHVLLNEMAGMLVEHHIPFVYLKSNAELVSAVSLRSDLSSTLDTLGRLNFFQATGLTQDKVLTLLDDIKMLSTMHSRPLASSKRDPVRDQRDALARTVMRAFETGLRKANAQLRPQLLRHPLIWNLFPYVAFLYDPQHPVLLATTQKLLRGFFDGTTTRRITALSDTVLFLDEFEIQEPIMLNALAAAEGVRNPFEFVRLFHDEMTAQRRQGLLSPLPSDSAPRATAREAACGLLDWITEKAEERGYKRFPHLARFTLDPMHFTPKDVITIFQSNTVVQTTPFSVVEEQDAWRIVPRGEAGTLSSRPLLELASRTTARVLDFFAQLWEAELEAEWREWIEQCYNRRNDHLEGAYHDIIRSYGQFRRPARPVRRSNADAIRNTLYGVGMSLYRIQRGTYGATAPEEAQILQRALSVTPEYILWQLASQNLVFAISATGDLPRLVNAFDLGWLKEHVSFLEPDADDRALIARLRAAKEDQRQYAVRLTIAGPLAAGHRLTRYLDALTAQGAFATKEDDGDMAQQSRRALVDRFLETARWVAHESQGAAHLVFVNSFRFISTLLEDKRRRYEQDIDDLTEHLRVERRSSRREGEYQLSVDGRPCALVLLNAEKARIQGTASFAYDPAEGPLIVVTQYETASNGVNLEWSGHPEYPGATFDFEGIHLLEGKHFYIGSTENEQEVDSDMLFAWKLWKLAEGRQIAHRTLMIFLKNWSIGRFNAQEYKRTDDYLLNQIALFHQAFGRVDRKRAARMPTEVRLADVGGPNAVEDGVFQLLERYLTRSGAIGEQREDRAMFTSPLILRIHEAVLTQRRRRLIANQRFRQDIGEAQDRSRTMIATWVQALGALRRGEYPPAQASAIRKGWLDIREALLRQDYHFTVAPGELPAELCLDAQRDIVIESGLIRPPGILLVDRRLTAILRDASAETITYDLNAPYSGLERNSSIRRFFHDRGYPLRHLSTVPGTLFTPHATQALLMGAIGEAALEALLRGHRIRLENPQDQPVALFELFDAKIRGLPLYLDAKHYRPSTLERMDARPEDHDYHVELNSARQLPKWMSKWQRIVAVTGDRSAKLIMINLDSDEGRDNQYWDRNGRSVTTYAESAVTLIQGALAADDPARERTPFLLWVGWVQEALGIAGQ